MIAAPDVASRLGDYCLIAARTDGALRRAWYEARWRAKARLLPRRRGAHSANSLWAAAWSWCIVIH